MSKRNRLDAFELQSLKHTVRGLCDLAWSKDGSFLYASGLEPGIVRWSAEGFETVLKRGQVGAKALEAPLPHPAGRRLAFVARKRGSHSTRRWCVLNLRTGDVRRGPESLHAQPLGWAGDRLVGEDCGDPVSWDARRSSAALRAYAGRLDRGWRDPALNTRRRIHARLTEGSYGVRLVDLRRHRERKVTLPELPRALRWNQVGSCLAILGERRVFVLMSTGARSGLLVPEALEAPEPAKRKVVLPGGCARCGSAKVRREDDPESNGWTTLCFCQACDHWWSEDNW